MQLRQLEYFAAVAEARHFTRAASAVHVAQPSLSKQIRLLERELGAPLFDRARGNVTLTAAGETLLPLATRILADAESAKTQVQELVGLVRGQLRLGATPTLSTVLLPAALRRFCTKYPGIDIHVEERGGRDLVRLLALGQLDLALVALPSAPRPRTRRDPDSSTSPSSLPRQRTAPLLGQMAPEFTTSPATRWSCSATATRSATSCSLRSDANGSNPKSPSKAENSTPSSASPKPASASPSYQAWSSRAAPT